MLAVAGIHVSRPLADGAHLDQGKPDQGKPARRLTLRWRWFHWRWCAPRWLRFRPRRQREGEAMTPRRRGALLRRGAHLLVARHAVAVLVVVIIDRDCGRTTRRVTLLAGAPACKDRFVAVVVTSEVHYRPARRQLPRRWLMRQQVLPGCIGTHPGGRCWCALPAYFCRVCSDPSGQRALVRTAGRMRLTDLPV